MAKNIRKPTTRKEPDDLIKPPPTVERRRLCTCPRTEIPTTDVCPDCEGDIMLDARQAKALLRGIQADLAAKLAAPTAPTTRRRH